LKRNHGGIGREFKLREIDRFVVLTRGAGTGKTSLVEALADDDLHHMPEAGRAIIQDQVAIGGHALPWSDLRAFAELMLSWELRSYGRARALSGTVIFGRGVPDVVGFLRLCGLPVPAHVTRAAATFRYYHQVFITPPWPAILGPDAKRKQRLEEAEATHRIMSDVYSGLGYDLMPLPRDPVSESARFVQERIS
jgi:predicted ATPase